MYVGVEQKEEEEREEKALEERQRGNLLNDKSHIFKRNYKKTNTEMKRRTEKKTVENAHKFR